MIMIIRWRGFDSGRLFSWYGRFAGGSVVGPAFAAPTGFFTTETQRRRDAEVAEVAEEETGAPGRKEILADLHYFAVAGQKAQKLRGIRSSSF